MDKEFHIYGCSDKITWDIEVKHPCIGLNYFPCYFTDVDYWMFIDRGGLENILTHYKGQPIITKMGMLSDKVKEDYELNIEYEFEPGLDLYGKCTVATYAIDWVIKQGYNVINLYGVLDTDYVPNEYGVVQWKHFYDKKPSEYEQWEKYRVDLVEDELKSIQNLFNVKINRPLK